MKKNPSEIHSKSDNFGEIFVNYSLLSDENIKLSINFSGDNKIINEDSFEELENDDENNDINEFQNNLDLANIEDNENDYYINLAIKDIDLDNYTKEMNDELSHK